MTADTRSIDAGQITHPHTQRRGPQGAADRGEQRHVTDKRHRRAGLSCQGFVTQGHGLQDRRGIHGSLDQIGVKRQQHQAIARRALREHAHARTLPQGSGNIGVGAMHGMPPAAFNEQRAGAACQITKHRPATNFRLGDKARRHDGVEHVDIQPGHMVGQQHQARLLGGVRHRSLKPQIDATDAQDAARPPANQLLTTRLPGKRKIQTRDEQAHQHIEREPRQSDCQFEAGRHTHGARRSAS